MLKFTVVMTPVRHYTATLAATLILLMMSSFCKVHSQSKYGSNDTIITAAVIYEGDTIPAEVLPGIYIWQRGRSSARAQWTRLRNAVYITYPYARRAAIVFNDIEKHIANNPNKRYVTNYINSKEKELRKEFTEPITNLSVYQGKVLMKLINRETNGVDCYSIVKQLKGGFTARFWQTIAFVFGSNLKQPYDPKGADAQIESIVKEVQRMYGWTG